MQAGRVADLPDMPTGARSGHFLPLTDRSQLPVCPTFRCAGMSAPARPHNSLGHREWPWRAIGAIGRGVVVIDPAALFRSFNFGITNIPLRRRIGAGFIPHTRPFCICGGCLEPVGVCDSNGGQKCDKRWVARASGSLLVLSAQPRVRSILHVKIGYIFSWSAGEDYGVCICRV